MISLQNSADDEEVRRIFEQALRSGQSKSAPKRHHLVPVSYLKRWAEGGNIRVTAWPGWRDLPLVPRSPDSASNSKKTPSALRQWVAHVNAVYPTGWLESGGPIRTRRNTYGTRHVPNHTGFGGYDLCGDLTDQQDPR